MSVNTVRKILIEHNLLSNFIKNAIEHDKKYNKQYIKDNHQGGISGHFLWHDTPEGSNVWSSLADLTDHDTTFSINDLLKSNRKGLK